MITNMIKSKANTVAYSLQEEAIRYIGKSVSNKFGKSIVANTSNTKLKTLVWLRHHDPKFTNHITAPIGFKQNGKQKFSYGNIDIVSKYIFKLDSNTFVYVSPINNYSNATISIGSEDGVDLYGIYLYIFGKNHKKYYKELIKMINSIPKSNGMVKMVYNITIDNGADKSSWYVTGNQMLPRQFDSVFFREEDKVKEQIIRHLRQWESNYEVYKQRGVPFKTGILLYGLPGTGKSTLATVIANYLQCEMLMIDTTKFEYLDLPSISSTINNDTNRYVILIDEIDTLFKSRDDENLSEEQKKNTSKLLSFLDSQTSPDNVVFIATTNYYDRLDSALQRKGRFDLALELNPLTEKEAIKMCNSFNLSDTQISSVLSKLKDNTKIIQSDLQGLIFDCMENKLE